MTGKVQFGQYWVDAAQVFYRTPLSLAIVNLKPIVPGHVLVIPQRRVERLADLSKEEVGDLFETTQRVGSVVEQVYGGSSLTVSLQDGKEAGMTVWHVHVHVVPRKKGDWMQNDDIYKDIDRSEHENGKVLESSKGVDNETRKARTPEEMAAEARMLEKYFETCPGPGPGPTNQVVSVKKQRW